MWVSPRPWFSKFLRSAAEAPGNLLTCRLSGPAPDVLVRRGGQGWGLALCMSLALQAVAVLAQKRAKGSGFLELTLLCALWTGHVT